MTKKEIVLVATLAAFGLGVLMQGRPSARDPQTLTLRTTNYAPGGVEFAVYFETATFRGDGSYATEEIRRVQRFSSDQDDPTQPGWRPRFEDTTDTVAHRLVVDVNKGTSVQVFPSVSLKSTRKLSQVSSEHHQGLHDDCSRKFKGYVREEAPPILGLEVEKYSREACLDCGSDPSIERWVAPSLGCYPVKEITTTVHNGNRAITKVKDLLSVEDGTKDDLFLVPPEFKESRPSEILALLSPNFGVVTTPQQFEHLDRNYLADHDVE